MHDWERALMRMIQKMRRIHCAGTCLSTAIVDMKTKAVPSIMTPTRRSLRKQNRKFILGVGVFLFSSFKSITKPDTRGFDYMDPSSL